jgi:hypothetical protein
MMSNPTGMFRVIPSRLAVGETFTVRVKVLGPVRKIEPHAGFNTRKPGLHSPFNLNACPSECRKEA